ncbi:MAG TPA: superinfection immunity protein [Patescibacteria group bacterium]|nr:superinfection immunity protein [Patescibacteria group bacterium]
MIWCVVAIFFLLYFIPTLIGIRKHNEKIAVILIINLLLGWTYVGWLLALGIALNKLH